jgi:hypothetical protein
MESRQGEPVGRAGWLWADYGAIIFLVLGAIAWLLALPIVGQCLRTIQEDPKGDGMIGVYFVALFAGLAGAVTLLVAIALAFLAQRLPVWLRVLCLVPGLLALLLAGGLFLA